MKALACTVCGSSFTRTGTRGPIPKYCSDACKAKKQRQRPERREYERLYRQRARATGSRRKYESEYNRRPEVRARNAERMRIKWHSDPEYRAKAMDRYRRRYDALNPFRHVVIPTPYTGHRWFDMARAAVGGDPNPEYRDFGWEDEVGEALLALLEGRDMGEAVAEFRRKEWVPRHMTTFLSEWHDSSDDEWREDAELPSVESAESEVVARETVGWYVKTRYSHGRNGRPLHGGRRKNQPSRRRMKHGKSWMKHAGVNRRAWLKERADGILE